ncbi:MAG: alpha-glucan family phosphorylase [Phycisphaerae bacterium]
MRPLRTFTIEPALPEALEPLLEIARNLWWCWHGEALNLFRRLDADLWEECYHNPVAMLGRIDQGRLNAVAADEGFLAHLKRVYDNLRAYMDNPGWWQKTYGENDQPAVAYFCAEFGLAECVPIYSGGLGVLAGDHLKSASELDIPLIAVGMLYQQGYFRQRLNADGWQLELYPRNDFHNMPVQPVFDDNGNRVTIGVELPGRTVKAVVWSTQIGRITLYMLDTNVPENSPEDRHITAQLYGGDQEMRIRQEILLGIGGVRMLKALNIQPKCFHMNEGHSAFLAMERIRQLMTGQGLQFDEASVLVSSTNVFTTHTPVPAGNDAFETWLIEKYFESYWPQLGLDRDQFMNLGRQDPGNSDEPLSLTVLALRFSAYRNGVSQLHGDVSRKLWSKVWPQLPLKEVPIAHITNGIHTPTWLSNDMASLYTRYLGPGWTEKPADMSVWKSVQNIPDTELWRTHERRRERLVAFARRRLVQQLRKRGAGSSEIASAQEILDPEALTIGFARRFATYKRASLILSDYDRLTRLLAEENRRVQIIFAGKAHPRDNPGKDLIRQIIHKSRHAPLNQSLVFIEDYDMNVARYLVQGVDVWLNTPLRPMEASGTSGMKVAANGGLNVSILDGWWAEGYEPDVGWAIGSGESYDNLEYQNAVESQSLYDLLEKEIIPLFYNRGQDNLPRGWIYKMKAAMGKLAPVYNTNRMVRQYAEMFYEPAMRQYHHLTGDDMDKVRKASAWRYRLWDNFDEIRIEKVSDSLEEQGSNGRVGQQLQVEAIVKLGKLDADDVGVELYCGRLDDDGQLSDGRALPMQRVEQVDGDRAKYSVAMPCSRSGKTGYTVRVVPKSDFYQQTLDLGLVKWA